MKVPSPLVRKPVYFFGLWEPLLGDYDGENRFPEAYDQHGVKQAPSFIRYLPWTRAELSGEYLRQRGILDKPDGFLHWAYAHYWHAWFWWDRSAKDEPGTCSVALAYQYTILDTSRALSRWMRLFPSVVQRQQLPFELANKIPNRAGKLSERSH